MALGVTGEALAAAIERIEAAATVERTASLAEAVALATTKADRELTARQARNARYYAANRLKASESKTVKTDQDDIKTTKTVSDAKPPAYVGSNSTLPSLRSEEPVGGGVDAGERVSVSPDDWPTGKASDHADLLIATVASPWLDPSKSPDLVTTRGRVAAWKRDGASWEHDVLPVVTGLCANRRARISSWKFFDQAVCRSIAENRAALEIPEASGRRQTGPPSWVDQISAVNAEARRRVLEAD